MNLKSFAQVSRNRLMEGVAKKLLYWGFDEKGNVLEEPQKISGGYLLRGEPFDDPNVPQLWTALKIAIQKKGIEVVVEEAAYTWFNRMMAIKILAKNGYDEPQLNYVEGMQHTPILLQRARQGQYGFLESKEQERLKKIISDYNKDKEAFALLLTGYCHSHNTLNRVFGKLDDYTELLLPDNMLQDGGFLHLLNTTDAISDEDYKSVEAIGWLYQFYISEKKQEVYDLFKKNKKAEAKDIPAATQIFTPNWIVKYMVENTAGKIWLDKNPDSALKEKMKYLVDTSTSLSTGNENDKDVSSNAKRIENKSMINNIEELNLMDPACGSGHILVEGFDLLYQMYMEEYYTPEEAVASILKNNLFGLDIDDRAVQLATFAILLKAAKVFSYVWSKDWLPQVYAMPETQTFGQQELKDFLGAEGDDYLEELDDALRLMKQAKNLGSVMKLKLSEEAQTYIAQRFEELKTASYRDFNVEAVFQSIQNYIPVLLLLTKKYTSVVANPPYLNKGNINGELLKYIDTHFSSARNDLYAVFILACSHLTHDQGTTGLICQESFMFTSSYHQFRTELLTTCEFDTMIHLGTNVFPEISGEMVRNSAFTYRKKTIKPKLTVVSRLVNFENTEQKRHAMIGEEQRFIKDFEDFEDLDSKPFLYWISKNLIQILKDTLTIDEIAKPRMGLSTGSVSLFIRKWHEVSFQQIGIEMSKEEASKSGKKWFLGSTGGPFNKWLGNKFDVVDWERDGFNIKTYKENKLAKGEITANNSKCWNETTYFKRGITWSRSAGNKLSFREQSFGEISTDSGPAMYVEESFNYLLGFVNSKVVGHIGKALNPTLSFQVGDLKRVPVLFNAEFKLKVSELVNESLFLSKKDLNHMENYIGFERSKLIMEAVSISESFQTWRNKAIQDFFQLHASEEELNRIFIDIYGLQEELTPEVALEDITILQEELNRKELQRLEPVFRAKGQDAIELPIDKGEVMSQFISYAIGLFMGRYRLDKPGLNIAHPNPSVEELASYTYNGSQVIIDEDAILPLMGSNCNFPDDALHQVYGLLDTLWGHDTRTENINFIQECLDKDLEKFLVKDFYKYHCSMYKKKPIYWLFSSKKGAFQVLVYMHRMNEFTAEKIRANYLLEQLKYLRNEESVMAGNEANLSTQEARRLDQIRKDIAECEAYDLELKNVADQQIKIDLDDGVTVNYAKFQSVLAKIK